MNKNFFFQIQKAIVKYQILTNFRHLFVVNAFICEKTKYKLKRPTMAGLKKN